MNWRSRVKSPTHHHRDLLDASLRCLEPIQFEDIERFLAEQCVGNWMGIMTYPKAATLFRLTFDSTCQFSRKATLCTSVHLLTSSSCFSNSHVVFALCYQLLSARTPVLRPMVSVFGTSAMLSTGVMATHSSRLRQPLYSARKSMASTSGPHHVPGVTKQVWKAWQVEHAPHLWELFLTLSLCWELNKNIVHIALLRSEVFVANN